MKSVRHCLLCQQAPENILALSCDHFLCLSCGWKLLQEENHSYSIVCSTCQEVTELPQTLYQQLCHEVQHHSSGRDPVSQNRNGDSEWQKSMTGKRTIRCEKHSEMELAYVCKACRNKMICSECIRRGPHLGHHVATIQEEASHITSFLQQQLSDLCKSVAQLKWLESTRSASNISRQSDLQGLRCQIRREYDEIRESIAREEQALLDKCDQLIELYQQDEVDSQTAISQQIAIIHNQQRTIHQILDPFLHELSHNRNNSKVGHISFVEEYTRLVDGAPSHRELSTLERGNERKEFCPSRLGCGAGWGTQLIGDEFSCSASPDLKAEYFNLL